MSSDKTLIGKKIIIISQQDWGKMFISKHHYAVELAKRGNEVYFLNSPVRDNSLTAGEIKIEDTGIAGLSLIKHRFQFPYSLKFKLRWLFDFLVKLHIRKILKKIGRVHVVWSFDLSNTLPLKAFENATYNIYMIADLPGKDTIVGAKGADIILSTNFSEEFLNKEFWNYPVPKKFVNHGVQDKFINEENLQYTTGEVINVGISGNFMRPDLDWPTIMKIVTENSKVIFHFYGAFENKNSNMSGQYDKGAESSFKSMLMALPNVVLYGIVTPAELSVALKKMDACLICYDIDKDQSKGTNYHKVLEYMATGRVIISNNITTYDNKERLIEMPVERNNERLPVLFAKVISNLGYYNSPEKQHQRVNFAKQHTYSANIEKIEGFVNSIREK